MITDHDQKIKGKIIILRTLSWIINNKCVPDEADGAAAVRSLRWRTHQMNNRNNHSRKMGTAGIAIWSRGGQSAHRARFFPFSFIFFYSFTCRQSMPRFLLTLSSPPSAGLIPRKILSIRIVRRTWFRDVLVLHHPPNTAVVFPFCGFSRNTERER